MKLREFWQNVTNPNEWQRRLLGLRFSEESPGKRGLVLIQVDGLSHPDLERAMEKRHMPFLRRLIRREHYRLWPMYSGVPSNTPSFQGEFFFGQRQCVPAFQFLDKKESKVFTMYEKKSAGEVERRMLEKNEGLIAGGSAYCNIFSGGAAESHICAATADIGDVLKAWNPYSLLITLVLSPFRLIRSIGLCLAETLLAFFDFIRGALKGQDAYMEFMFIFTRVLSTIMFREVATAHAQMDIYRGLPVVHINFFGYDEQAHRRGPSTRFAYWSLSGIDSAIRTLWFSAMHAKRRHYDVWIYSDHGHVKVTPFVKAAGKTIQEAVKEIYNEKYLENTTAWYPSVRSEWGESAWERKMRLKVAEENPDFKTQPIVTTLGPICQIYFPTPRSRDEKRAFAKDLLEKYPALPVAAIPHEKEKVEYLTREGIFHLPENAEKLLGEHPYRRLVAEDVECLLKHESRGDIVIFGWSAGQTAISFSNENGAHAGLTPRETQAFALLPADAPLEKPKEEWIRVHALRQTALKVLGKLKTPPAQRKENNLRVMTYNVHSCVGMDGVLSVDRIARTISKFDPDVVAIQELDTGMRIKNQDQAAAIAAKLEMHFHFHAVCGVNSGCFGNAIFSRYPIQIIRAEQLPVLAKSNFFEPRGLLWAEIDFFGRKIHILNTHLSLWTQEQEVQVEKLLGPDVLGHKELGEHVVLCGDFNMTPDSRYFRQLTQHFKEPKFHSTSKTARKTWTGLWPVRRLDYILMKGPFEGEQIVMPRTRLERYASDHLPVVTDFHFKPL